jgi:hypothetical protein
MLECEFAKHAEELKELKASTEYYLTKYRKKLEEVRHLGIDVKTSPRGVLYFFPVTEIKYVDIMRSKI